eukprot:TRINITY_DN13093_c0_g1_i1.p1 TRINITY_DN13093_c0_g1~~TRINITY_DN13093_c0_g1_i1.p1  ORF type:complete len:164 (+),score=20.69 TRINITY_DN13093_c0_g1_i1:2-493(+)
MGDEYGHTKLGNNNTWCQDNELSWFLWNKISPEKTNEIHRFYRLCIRYRKSHKILCHEKFVDHSDIEWHGVKPFTPDWSDNNRFVAFTFKDTEFGEFVYVAFNCFWQPLTVELPPHRIWLRVIETWRPFPEDFEEENPPPVETDGSNCITLLEHSAVLFKAAM